ncbi:DUF2624 family protein [Virgibacillus halodenitrificans]|uniref:DUF2624 family protein n=1 Tax=Virgibacillus halodenitrificans TaxID=1482 RepID=A0AAC9IZ51_VIRHA|nr:DUF2624 family protein [Virgibacillus halodenitrificans]APC48242.1 hypothetical protein BME96_08660 [Virgibacillus halodenitrificans]MCG1029246.1 DUF2624 domain-containing protein [Virgibacillus halodenitrificans]MYL46597.1 DUF2624 family protein [Virgibacillus halodenitrificans]CDQ35481.1 hypothetical protein BN993_04957 [Virgibacillus halodenitrificans]
MSTFIKGLIKNKLKQLTGDELINYGKEYGFAINQTEAKQIINYLHKKPIDPFTSNGREIMFRDLARITNLETARKAQKVFYKLIKSYGVEHLFKE